MFHCLGSDGLSQHHLLRKITCSSLVERKNWHLNRREGRQPLYVINGETLRFVTPYSANYDLREGDGGKQENEALEGGRVMWKEN